MANSTAVVYKISDACGLSLYMMMDAIPRTCEDHESGPPLPRNFDKAVRRFRLYIGLH